MLGKLIKYEFKSSIRIMLIVWLGVILSSIISGFYGGIIVEKISFLDNIPILSQSLYILVWTLYILSGGALLIITIVLSVNRFMKGVVGEEGYLIHTIPVKKSSIILSKSIVSAVYFLIAPIIALISIFIIADFHGQKLFLQFGQYIANIISTKPVNIVYLVEILVLICLYIVVFIYIINTSICIGQLANKHRALLSIGAFIGINMIFSFISTVILYIGTYFYAGVFEIILGKIININEFLGAEMVFGFFYIICLVPIVVLHMVSSLILEKKLNLL